VKRLHIVLATVVFSLLCFAVISALRDSAEKRGRAELYMLDTIRTGVLGHLNNGGAIPNSWSVVSNAVNWTLVVGIAQHNSLPPATEMYTILARPVAFSNVLYRGSIFLVRSKPQGWGSHSGRWILIGSSNRVSRTWIGEKYLMPEIRSQIENENKTAQ
jgi:hypothetical protein